MSAHDPATRRVRAAAPSPLRRATKELRKRKVSIRTVIFGDGDEDCEALGAFGPVMKLEDVVEACGSG